MAQEFLLQPSPIKSPNNSVNPTVPGYQRGNWTPHPFFNTSTVGMDYSATGEYEKVGRLVRLSFGITYGYTSSCIGGAFVSNFPFPANDNFPTYGPVYWFLTTNNFYSMLFQKIGSTGKIYGTSTAINAPSILTAEDLNGAPTTLYITLTYTTV